MIRLLTILAAAALAAPAAAEPVRLTADQAVARALAEGEEVRSARAGVKEAEGRVREAVSVILPQISGSLSYGRTFDSIYEGLTGGSTADSGLGDVLVNSPFAAANNWTAELTASQVLWDFKVGAALKAARHYKDAALARERETGSDLAFEVRRAYWNAAATEALVAIAEGGREQAREHAAQVALFHREGTRAEFDLLRAQVDASHQEPVVVAARNARTLAMLELKRLINLPLDQELQLDTGLASGMLPVLAEDSTGAPTRGALDAAEATIDLQEQAIRVRQAQDWPSLSVSTTLMHQAFPSNQVPNTNDFHRDWQAAVRLDVPIFSGFRNHGAADREKALLMQATADRDRLLEETALQIARARAELIRTQTLLSSRRETVRQAKRAFELSELRYGNGLSTQLEVSDTRYQMQTAEVDQVQAIRDYLVAIADLERALGHPVKTEIKPIEQISLLSPEEGTR